MASYLYTIVLAASAAPSVSPSMALSCRALHLAVVVAGSNKGHVIS